MMSWPAPITTFLLGVILGVALWTPALPWLVKSLGVANILQLF